MEKLYKKYLKDMTSISNPVERLTQLTSLLRSLLHVAVVSTFELTKEETPYDDVGLVDLINRFKTPVDGLPLDIFTHLTPTLRTYTSNNFLLGWFEETDNITLSLDKQLRKWVEFRNKLAHGGVDTNIAEEWSIKTENIIKNCLIVFNSILPSLNNEKEMKLSSEFQNLKINIPLLYKEQIFVIRAISEKQRIWQLKGQLVSKDNAEEFSFQLDEKNIFSLKEEKSNEKYNLIEFISNNQECLLNHNIPIRQTNTFVGRESEIQQLKEWMDDEDSRYALVYGDGGYGKTTLVLKFGF